MKLQGILFSILFFFVNNASSQETIYKFWVQLSDKKHNSFSLDKPGEFLSQRAIDRRQRQGISIGEEDIPVSRPYLDSLSAYPLRILYTSRWMNAAIIQTSDSSLALSLPGHEFVDGVEYLYRSPWTPPVKSSGITDTSSNNKYSIPGEAKKSEPSGVNPAASLQRMDQAGTALVSDHQVEMLNGHLLHQGGYRGEGLIIAVLDAGFPNVNTLEAFKSLNLDGRILGTRNFVEPESGFWWTVNGTHGTNVLSAMAGDIMGEFRGSAPEASYLLLQTEDSRSEFRIEEANWLAGAELADSIGADIINSSLGYLNVFTDPSQNYSYSDLDGKTTLVTRAAELAAARGILVVTSAGNSGRPGNSWGYITAPADGDNVLAVGAVDSAGNRTDFSSYGPTYDQRIKPDVMAQGDNAWLVSHTGVLYQGGGTSFSSPIVAGLAACLWQKNPDVSSLELIDYLRNSGSVAGLPDTLVGYGLPDFYLADRLISGISEARTTEKGLHLYPNPATAYISIGSDFPSTASIQYHVFDISGRNVLSGMLDPSPGNEHRLQIQSLNAGTYLLVLQAGGITSKGIFIKTE